MSENISSGSMPISEKSPLRVKMAFKYSGLEVRSTIEGVENLPSAPCVVAATHLSNVDMPQVVMAIADKRKIGFVGYENPLSLIMGRESFFPITGYLKRKDGYDLMQRQFQKMRDGITREGRAMVIAAHNPTHDWKLPESPGIGAVILAHLTNVPIVPVAVDIESSTPIAKPRDISRVKNILTGKKHEAKISFCKPIQISEMPEEQLRLAMKLYVFGEEAMPKEEIVSAKEALKILRDEGESMMLSLALKLSPEKRGKWGSGRTVA